MRMQTGPATCLVVAIVAAPACARAAATLTLARQHLSYSFYAGAGLPPGYLAQRHGDLDVPQGYIYSEELHEPPLMQGASASVEVVAASATTGSLNLPFVGASGSIDFEGIGGYAYATCMDQLYFSVDGETPFYLTGSLVGSPEAIASLSLSTIFLSGLTPELSESGILLPGENYVMSVSVTVTPTFNQSPTVAARDISLVFPEPRGAAVLAFGLLAALWRRRDVRNSCCRGDGAYI